MSLMAEDVVVEWLNRDGYFTIRGIRLAGNHEIDVLAIKPANSGCGCRHIEITVSPNPMGRICYSGAKKADDPPLMEAVLKWIEKKFNQEEKATLRQRLCPGQNWTRELVVGKIKFEDEIEVFRCKGIIIHRLKDIITAMNVPGRPIKSAAGADLFDLMMLFREAQTNV